MSIIILKFPNVWKAVAVEAPPKPVDVEMGIPKKTHFSAVVPFHFDMGKTTKITLKSKETVNFSNAVEDIVIKYLECSGCRSITLYNNRDCNKT